MTNSTANLIAEYDARMADRHSCVQVGSSRWVSRQAHINAIVDELDRRADAGDAIAESWFTAT